MHQSSSKEGNSGKPLPLGCDGPVLLDDTQEFKGEKNVLPNRNSIRGFEVVDGMKADVEKSCPAIVSCLDILTLAAKEAVSLEHILLVLLNASLSRGGSGKPNPTLDSSFLLNLQSTCSDADASNSKLAPLDSQSIYRFDNMYYKNLLNNTGLLESDQALIGDPKAAAMVKDYSMDPFLCSKDFAASMVKLGNIVWGDSKKCRFIN
ncbi:peroxidase 10 [Olea europaea subsp. europaea]|uniref:peroxidase n=1 Tax=Olea europaea subsp. europaea TaxID=158383 RepID=A0A8S0QHS4_OLEEU|nr:peroxidase 10 [Olea europaea subsp. europaea]